MNITELIENTRKAGELFESQGLIEIADECERMREAMQEFVDRCDRGEVLSSYTRGKFEKILAGDKPTPSSITVDTRDIDSVADIACSDEWFRQ